MINPLDLTGKHVLVTGASSGIGKATAIHLSKLGAKLSIVARSVEKLEKTLSSLEGEEHSIYSTDLKDINEIGNLVEGIVRNGGAIDGFIHCAGIASLRPISMTTFDYLHEMMSLNFYAFVELIRCLSKKKNFRAGASFIGMSSVASKHGDKSKIAYASSKAAMDAAVRCMAKELAHKEIRVNTIVAGFIRTDMYEEYIKTAGEEGYESTVSGMQYLGLGDTTDIANAMAYLLSDSSRFITGTGFVVDGGFLS